VAGSLARTTDQSQLVKLVTIVEDLAEDEATVECAAFFVDENELASLPTKVRILLAEPLYELLDGPNQDLWLTITVILPA